MRSKLDKYNLIIFVFIFALFFYIPKFIFRNNDFDVIAGGDFRSFYPSIKYVKNNLFLWGGLYGQGTFNSISVSYLYYLLVSFVYSLIGNHYLYIQISLFFLISFFSFYYALSSIFKVKVSTQLYILISLAYSLNPFNLVLYSYSWGYSHHFLIYPLVPYIFSVFFTTLTSKNKEVFLSKLPHFLLSLILIFLCINNLGFLFAFLLLSFLIFIFYSFYFKINLIRRYTLMILVVILFFLPYLLGFLLSNLFVFTKLTTTEAFGGDLSQWYSDTANSVLSVFSISRSGFNPNLLLGVLFLFLVIYGSFKIKDRMYKVFLMILIIISLLLFRYYSSFYYINSLVYSIPGFGLLRSSDKLLIFFPFFCFILIAYPLFFSGTKVIKLATGIVLLFSFTFVSYKLYTKYINREISCSSNKDYCNLIKIPGEYKIFSNYLGKNNISNSTSIISLPYSKINSINWSNYPAWKFVGGDVLSYLFDINYISANTYDHINLESKLTFRDLKDDMGCCSESELVENFQRFGVEYIIWHKDIRYDRLTENSHIYSSLISLVESSKITEIEKNDLFVAYRLSDFYIDPLISVSDANLSFKRINPTKYILEIKNLKVGDEILFKQSFNPEWKIYASDYGIEDCPEKHYYTVKDSAECIPYGTDFVFGDIKYLFRRYLNVEHTMVDNYANSWNISSDNLDELANSPVYSINEDGTVNITLVIYFRSQSLLILQYIFLLLVGILVVTFFTLNFYRKVKKDI